MTDPRFAITQKGRAYLDAADRPRGGNAPWLRAQPQWTRPRFTILRRSAETLSPAA